MAFKYAVIETPSNTLTTLATLATVSNSLSRLDAWIVASNPANSDMGTVHVSGAIKNVAGVASVLGSTQNFWVDAGLGVISVSLGVSGANLLIQVTGKPAVPVQWLLDRCSISPKVVKPFQAP